MTILRNALCAIGLHGWATPKKFLHKLDERFKKGTQICIRCGNKKIK